MAEIFVSDHADKRLRARFGVPRRALSRLAQRAFEKGVELRRAVDAEFYMRRTPRDGVVMRCFAGFVFVFDTAGRCITAFPAKYVAEESDGVRSVENFQVKRAARVEARRKRVSRRRRRG